MRMISKSISKNKSVFYYHLQLLCKFSRRDYHGAGTVPSSCLPHFFPSPLRHVFALQIELLSPRAMEGAKKHDGKELRIIYREVDCIYT